MTQGGIGIIDPEFSFGICLGVIKERHMMGQICLYIVTIYLIPVKYRCVLSILLVKNSNKRSSKFLVNSTYCSRFGAE